MSPMTAPAVSLPRWTRPVALAGLAWNLYGVFQFVNTALATRDGLVRGGMTAAQADLYQHLPGWMTVAFAVGVLGGTLGCLLLLVGRREAARVFAASLAGYVALFAGDLIYGVFAAFGWPQVAILTLVVVIAAGLWRVAQPDRWHAVA